MSQQHKTHEVSLDEALQLLNEAAKNKQKEIRGLVSHKYSHLKELFEEMIGENMSKLEHAQKSATEAIHMGTEKAKEVASDVDHHVRQRPWQYIGGTAVAALLLGFIMGSRRG